MELRPYQIKCLDAMDEAAKRGVTRQLIVSAVGTGKTTVLAAFLRCRGFPKTYAVMHRHELLKQMRDRFLSMKSDLKIGFDKAELHPDPIHDDIILASVQSVGREDDQRLAEIPKDWPRIVAVDECHHAPSNQYLNVLNAFGLYGIEPRRDVLSIGLTATPERLDQLGYDNIFDDVVFRYGLRDGIRDGWLADVKAWKVKSGVDLSGVKVSHGDFVEKELNEIMNTEEHNRLAAEVWAEHCRGRRSLFFCVTKDHAYQLHVALEAVKAKVVTIIAETDQDVRTSSIKALKDGAIEAIVNVGVFSEGTDIPEVDCVHMLRPTRSQAYYTQCMGRGIRKIPGKNFMELFDHTGSGHDVCSIGRIFGLPDSWELDGDSVEGEIEALEEAVEDLGISIDGLKGMEDLQERLSSRETRVNIIKGSLTAADLPSSLVWIRPSREERYIISWRNETREEVDRMKLEYQFAALSAMEPKNLFGISERIEIFRNELGKYEGRIYRRSNGARTEHPMGSDASLAKLVGQIEGWVIEKRAHKAGLMKKSARWAKEPASQGQLDVLKKKGIPQSFVEVGTLTKREASILMGLPRKRIQALFGNVF